MKFIVRIHCLIFCCVLLSAICTSATLAQATRPRTVGREASIEISRGKKGETGMSADAPMRNDESLRKTDVTLPLKAQFSHELSTDELPVSHSPAKTSESFAVKTESFFSANITSRMRQSIEDKLGAPYRFSGTTNNGYDCSGFVWKVFQDSGFSFERGAARHYWAAFPEATQEETKQFGTLIFFSGLSHVGIVRDAGSFYHASRTRGVMLSLLDGYWSERITGYRRVPLSPLPADAPIKQTAGNDTDKR
jgi:cell wall-associated NlpC family hydrolase